MSSARRRGIWPSLALLALLLAACSSTTPMPQRAAERSDAPPPMTPAAATEQAAVAIPDGPITASMDKLQLNGERYAALGDPAAPITIVEFSDFGCPFCRVHATSTLQQLKAAYIDTGKVYYVFKDFPIRELHPQALLAAEAAECAGAQGRYWQMHDQLFAEPSEWDGSSAATAQASFTRYATQIGLDQPTFEQCLASEQVRAEIQRDSDEARGLGLTGTPAFIINGRLLSGARPFEQFRSVLDGELAER